MSFLWPGLLGLLLLTPLLIIVYLRLQRRRQRAAAVFESPGSLPAAASRRPGIRRHIPPVLFLAGLVILIAALARPQASLTLPRVEGTVILVVDVSGSMAANDAVTESGTVTRLEAAKAAAREFVVRQPAGVQIGVVSFSEGGFTVQTPTYDQEAALAAINRLAPQRGTSVGQGILASLKAITVDAGAQAPEVVATPDPAVPPEDSMLLDLPEGSFPSAVIVLISDGENLEAPDPLAAAEAAAERDVRIYPLGVGSPAGITLEVEGFSVHTRLDETALQTIAQITGGTYVQASSAEDLTAVYDNLVPQWVVKPDTIEVTAVFAGASMVMMLAASLFSLVWFGRVV